MANNHFLSFVYGEGEGKSFPPQIVAQYNAAGQQKSFPSIGTVFHSISPAVVINGVSCVSVIEVLPQGLQQYSRKYFSADTIATLNTNAT